MTTEASNHLDARQPNPEIAPMNIQNPPTQDTNEEEKEEEEEDPLVIAQRRRELEEEQALQLAEASNIQSYDDPAMKAFYSDMKEVDRENEVNRILGAFKLNPFEALALRFDASIDDIKRAYRKVSLTVHPDKCPHPQARDAFETIGAAHKLLLDDEQRDKLLFVLNIAREEIREAWKKASKNDAAVRIAASLDEQGIEGVQSSYEKSDDFHEKWKLKSRDMLARTEWRKRRLTKRITEGAERAKEDHKIEKERAKAKAELEKEWEKSRDNRVGSWRDFMNNNTTKKKKKTIGGIKPPKVK